MPSMLKGASPPPLHYPEYALVTHFIPDSELERAEAGFTVAGEKSSSMPRSHDNLSSDEDDRISVAGIPDRNLGVSIFDYMDRLGNKTCDFYNTVYCPELQQTVLRPFSHLSDLVLWDYYIREELRHGPSYDPEYTEADLSLEEDGNVAVLGKETRSEQITLTQGLTIIPLQSFFTFCTIYLIIYIIIAFCLYYL